MSHEIEEIRQRYQRRTALRGNPYAPLKADVYLGRQEKERALVRWIEAARLAPVCDRRLLEIGCGSGANLLQFLQLGFLPENIVGNELLAERAAMARRFVPASVKIITGDASTLDLPESSFDVVFQSTVFTSIIDDPFQEKLANHMWYLVKPGGGVLWYDFVYNNPANPDVRGVPLRRVRELFPDGEFTAWRLTLAPPIARRVTMLHPAFYTLFNVLPFLRTHVLCWIKKLDRIPP